MLEIFPKTLPFWKHFSNLAVGSRMSHKVTLLVRPGHQPKLKQIRKFWGFLEKQIFACYPEIENGLTFITGFF